MPRREEAGLENTKSISSDLNTSTMKSDPGGPESVPAPPETSGVPSSACAAAVEGRFTKAAVASASAARAPLTAGTAPAAPATATPARNLRRLTSVRAFLRAMTFPPNESFFSAREAPFGRDIARSQTLSHQPPLTMAGLRAGHLAAACLRGE